MKRLAQIRALTFLLQLVIVVAPALAQKQKPKTATTRSTGRYAQQIGLFDQFVKKQMANDKTPGLSIAFMKDHFIWSKAYGFADLENRVPAKPESAYRLASVTKPMTAVAILQLVEKGKINLDAEVQTYVPYFPRKQRPVTVRQLLGHLSGISHYKNPTDELHIKTHKTTREAIAIFENFDLIAEPGTRYSYSSYGYNLLGAVIEGASGMSYSEYMKRNVWGPLGMTDTHMDDPLELIPNRVRGYQLVNGQVTNSEFVDISSRFAAGGTRSTVIDLLKFARGLMDGKLLSGESMKLLSSSMATREGRLTNYGMGWETTPYNGRYFLIHSGGQQETRTLLYVLPTLNFAIAAAVNFEDSSPGAYVERLFQLITGGPTYFLPYSGDKLKSAFLDAINSTFNSGLSQYERQRRALSADPAEISEAFAYFNKSVNSEALKKDPESTLKKIKDGVQPVAKQPFATVGSYMAARLAETYGPRRLESYPVQGGLAFFQDYIALSSTDPKLPAHLRFNEEFARTTGEMAAEWKRTNTKYARLLWLLPDANIDELGRTLRKTFAGASVYPNLVDDFFSLTRQLASSGNRVGALKASMLSMEFYSAAPVPNVAYGLSLILNGKTSLAEEPLRKAAAIDPSGLAGPDGLNNVAYQLAGNGMVNDAIEILKTAIQLYPQEANLYDSLGEFQLKNGDKAKALQSYKRALELNPNFPNAAAAREIVKKLSSEPGGK